MSTAFLWALFLGTAQAEPVLYGLDSESSRLTVRVFKEDSALSDLAHDHIILATKWTGSATLDVSDAGSVVSCDVKVVVPVNALEPDLPEQRKKESMKVMLTEAQRAQVKEHMLDEDQLDETSHGQIRFAATRCSGTLEALQVDGQLTVQDRNVPIQISLKTSITEGQLQASGQFQVSHKDLGLTPYSAFMGTLKNQQKLVFGVDVSGKAK